MIALVLKRIGLLIATVFTATTLLFALIHASGDPTDGFLAPGASSDLREATRHRLHLDQPLPEQYARFLWNGMTGQFGDSWRDRQPATDAIFARLPATLELMFCAVVMAVVLGVALGVTTAWLRNAWVRGGLRVVTLLGQAVPSFWLGTLLILLFAVKLDWLPSSGNQGWQAMILPGITLALYPASVIARLLESGLRDASTRAFVSVARAKGLSRPVILLRHVLPNAMMPVLGYVGLQVSFLVGGSVIVESVFAYPGLGRFVLQAATERDLPVIQAFVVTVAVLVVLGNLVIDLLALVFDPRMRDQQEGAAVFG